MYLSQTKDNKVIWRVGDIARIVLDVDSTQALANKAIQAGKNISDMVEKLGLGEIVDLAALLQNGQLDCPIRHADEAHMHLTGTGLTHLGSAATRDAMHSGPATDDMTDSMKMFRMGVDGGKPAPGQTGVQPEWFYKGTGAVAVAPEGSLMSPAFALDGGEEPEIAGIYVISENGTPYRLGFALANEFSDHVTERQNYLYLAHSKLRPASFGPEIRTGDLPAHVEGMSRVTRGNEVIWEKPFVSGEDNMSHTVDNLQYHHFKYDLFCKPGDIHVHFFGTATLSFADKVDVQEGDRFEISSADFGLPLRNRLQTRDATPVTVRSL